MSDWLVSTEWLTEHLNAPDIVILDASWHLPPEGRDAKAEYLEEHIPGALFFDLDDLSDETSDFPHMLPPPAKFASRMRKLGIGDGKRVIVYDTKGLFAAARCWWMFRVFGHDDVALLDGGLRKWKTEVRPLEDELPPPRQERHFTARLQSTMVRDIDDILSAISGSNPQLLDARSASRFTGEEKEPRPGLKSGHMPGAKNIHYASLLNADGTFRKAGQIREVFEQAGVDLRKPAITTCGSGVTAAILSLGLDIIGHRNNALYDGSWSEWGAMDVPVATGED